MVKKKRAVKKTVNKKSKKITVDSGTVTKKIKGQKKYTIQNLQDALNAMGEGLTLRQAAKTFGIPKSTLSVKSKNMSPLDCKKGPKTILSTEDEKIIVHWIVFCAETGVPVTKSRLLDSITSLVEDKTTPFKNNRPGQHWYRSFKQRHPNVIDKMARNFNSTGAFLDEKNLRDWFARVKLQLIKKNLLNIEAERVFTLGECVFKIVGKDKADSKKTAKIPNQQKSNEEDSLTVLFTSAASGVMPPPMILFDSKNPPKKNMLDQIPKDWGVSVIECESITAKSFYNYISNVFYKWLKENNYIFPIILYIDGRFLNISLELFKFCTENHIELIGLYPNAMDIIQPLEVAIFQPLKNSYKEILHQWINNNDVLNFKKMFDQVLKLSLDSHNFAEDVEESFRNCGLYPFNANSIDYDVLREKCKQNNSTIEPDSTSNAIYSSVESYEQLLEVFEKILISPTTLESFKKAESVDKWTGDLTYDGLFEAWRKLKRLCFRFELKTFDAQSSYDELDFDDVIETVKVEDFIDNDSKVIPNLKRNTQIDSPTGSEVEFYDNMTVGTLMTVMGDANNSSNIIPIDPILIVSTELDKS